MYEKGFQSKVSIIYAVESKAKEIDERLSTRYRHIFFNYFGTEQCICTTLIFVTVTVVQL